MFKSDSDFLLFYYEAMGNRMLSPQIIIDMRINNGQGIIVPSHLLDMKSVTFNISPIAVDNLRIDQQTEYISFNARFQGIPFDVHIPFINIIGMNSKEEPGLWFPKPLNKSSQNTAKKEKTKSKPELKLVANNPGIVPKKSKADLKIVK